MERATGLSTVIPHVCCIPRSHFVIVVSVLLYMIQALFSSSVSYFVRGLLS